MGVAKEENNNKAENTARGDTLIVYFSRAGENYGVGIISVGNTAMMANYIEEVKEVRYSKLSPQYLIQMVTKISNSFRVRRVMKICVQ